MSEYSSVSNVIAFSNAKEAFLYTDYVLPSEMVEVIPKEGSDDLPYYEVLQALLPAPLLDSRKPIGLSDDIVGYFAQYLCAFPAIIGVKESDLMEHGETYQSRWESRKDDLMNKLASLYWKSQSNGIWGLEGKDRKNELAGDEIICSLRGLRLVDLSDTSWRHVIEFKKDRQSALSLKRLKLFLYDGRYEGKDSIYIQDSLEQLIQDYGETAKKWGFMTKIADFQYYIPGAMPVLASLLTGGEKLEAGLWEGLATTIGSITVGICQGRKKRHDWLNKSDIGYLIKVKNLNG